MSRFLSTVLRWLGFGSSFPAVPGFPEPAAPAGVPGLPGLPGLPASPAPPTLPSGSTSLSSTPGGAALPSLAAALPNHLALTPDLRRRLQPPPFWHPAVVVSLTERPG
ncbi:hypothetical protein [Candidatus Nephthysia bennettiae]|nr:hypothetical protein [Candidatus Dormibacteraeota bacterium]